MQFTTLSFATLLSVAYAASAIETVTDHHTTEVTITSCSDDACDKSTVAPVESTSTPAPVTVITTTVSGEETIYTTICPETETTPSPAPKPETATTPVEPTSPAPKPETATIPSPVEPTSPAPKPTTAAPEPTTAAPEPVVPESESDSYIDITVTPTVTSSTGVEHTETLQSTFTSVYQNSTTLAPAVTSFNGANSQKMALGAVGIAGLALLM
jgi:outer membrane biosynthesis protein TonB